MNGYWVKSITDNTYKCTSTFSSRGFFPRPSLSNFNVISLFVGFINLKGYSNLNPPISQPTLIIFPLFLYLSQKKNVKPIHYKNIIEQLSEIIFSLEAGV